jgi:hypothetical protein
VQRDIRLPENLDLNRRITRDQLSRAPSQAIDRNELPNTDVCSMPESSRLPKAAIATKTVAPRLLRIKDGARYLAVRPEKLRQLIRDGRIPRILDRDADAERTPWRVDRCDLDAYIESNRETLN